MAGVAEGLLAGKAEKSLSQAVTKRGGWGVGGVGVFVFKKTFKNNIICCRGDEIPPPQLRQTAEPWQSELSFSLCYWICP